MATSTQQGTYAAQNGVNWAAPGDPNFGKPGYINQSQYDQYTAQYSPQTDSSTYNPQQAAAAAASPTTPSTPPAPSYAGTSTQQGTFAAQNGVNWAAPGDPNFGQPGFVNQSLYDKYSAQNTPQTQDAPGSTSQTPASPNPYPMNPTGGQSNVAPTGTLPNPMASSGMTDTMRQALLAQMGQNPVPTAQDPTVQAEMAPYIGAREEAARNAINTGAEGAFANQQDYSPTEARAEMESAGKDIASQTGNVVANETAARRAQINNALQLTTGMTENDIGNFIKEQGLVQTGQLGNRELDIKDQLGKLGLTETEINALLSDQEFMASLGLQTGIAQQNFNNLAGQTLLNG
jgi:hypothetical protein